MILSETESLPAAALPLEAFGAHLRLGSGFGTESLQAELLEGHLRAAMAAIEGHCGKVLISRGFCLRLGHWRGVEEQALPCAPVTAVAELAVLDAKGGRVVSDPARWRLVEDLHRPRLVARGAMLPLIPQGGAAEILFTAGFGDSWQAVPADLQQAVLLLAAEYYETRHEGERSGGSMPFGVTALIGRWRNVRLLAGRRGA